MRGSRILLQVFVLSIGVWIVAGCAGPSGSLTLEDVDPAGRSVIQTHTAGGEVESIRQKTEDGETVYKVKYQKDGKGHELKVTGAGRILEQERELTLEELPAAVKATVERETAGAEIDELVLETEEGETFYEVEFEKDDQEHEVKIAEDGSILEHETE